MLDVADYDQRPVPVFSSLLATDPLQLGSNGQIDNHLSQAKPQKTLMYVLSHSLTG